MNTALYADVQMREATRADLQSLLAHGRAPEALVESVVVRRNAQGQGIGRAMMRHAMQIAEEHGCYKLALTSNQQRQGAHAFYDRLGFQRHGVSFVVTGPSACAASGVQS